MKENKSLDAHKRNPKVGDALYSVNIWLGRR